MSMSVRASSFRSPPGLDNVNSDADDNDNDFVGDANLESFVIEKKFGRSKYAKYYIKDISRFKNNNKVKITMNKMASINFNYNLRIFSISPHILSWL
jgi:hypothetical protein